MRHIPVSQFVPMIDNIIEFILPTVSEVEDICRVSEMSKQSGYVKTPLYPISYPTHTECKLTIKTAFPNQKLRLYAIDFHLETNNTKCPDLFRAYDDLRSYSACGSRSRDLLFKTQSNTLTLEFMSNHEIRKKGFWLYYEGEGKISLT